MLTWQEYVAEMPAEWAEPIGDRCRDFQCHFRTEPVKAAEAILDLDRLWGEFEETDHLTPLIAQLLNPCSPRGCHDDTPLSYQAWWLAQHGMKNSAQVLLDTFEPENEWAQLAQSCLDSTEMAPPPLKSYRGKLRKIVAQVRQHQVDDVVSLCQADPRSSLSDSLSETVAFELACAGHGDLADQVWRFESDPWNPGLVRIVKLYQRLGLKKESRRLARQCYGRSWESCLLFPPITSAWDKLEAFARAKPYRGYKDLLWLLLQGFPASKRLPDPRLRPSWIEESPQLGAVCQAAWQALRGHEWSVSAQDTDEPAVIAGWAQLCERTGRHQEAAQLCDRLPPSWETYFAEQRLGANDPSYELFLQYGRDEAPKLLAERARTEALQLLLDEGRSKEAAELSDPIELLNIANILDPVEDWDVIESRARAMRPSSHKIRLLLLLGRARRAQGRSEEAQSAFEAVHQVHPQPIKLCGGDRIPPFQRPVDIVAVAETVLQCLNPDSHEPILIDYLLELPTSQVLLEELIDRNNYPPTLEHYQGKSRLLVEKLISRFADFPHSSSFAIGHLAWLHPHTAKELEKLLLEA